MKTVLLPPFIFISVAVVAVGCMLTGAAAVAQEFIMLSKGGGVTGKSTVFKLTRSGEVSRGAGAVEPEFSEFARLRKCKTKKFFRKTCVLLKNQTFNYPGNMYTAIALVDEGRETRMVWGDTSREAPHEAQELYQKMVTTLNRLTFRKDIRK